MILYSYIWRHEAARGEESGRKDRPCLVLATTPMQAGMRVIVAPLTTKRYNLEQSIDLPPNVLRYLGLPMASAIVCDDLNRFTWVGPDVRITANRTPFYGQVPARLFETVRARVIANAVKPTRRTE